MTIFLILIVLAQLERPRMPEDVLLVDDQEQERLEADENIVQLGGRHFSKQRSALDLDQPRVLEGVRAERPVKLAEHGVASKLEAGEQKMPLAKLILPLELAAAKHHR